MTREERFEYYLSLLGKELDYADRIKPFRIFFPFTVAEMEEAASLIALELRRQYGLGYAPTNQRRDGKWRTIKVRVRPLGQRSNVTVRAREGYYAAR